MWKLTLSFVRLHQNPLIGSPDPSMADNDSNSSSIGHLDVALNHKGRQQAVLVAERLSKGPKISSIYSSNLKRAYDTAETIASCYGGIEVVKDPELRERNLGDLQGHEYRELSKTVPIAYEAFLHCIVHV
uniref:Uncharacterized protein n=1 Tax=Kalanchoe fedtschenkoi TaxID=63787 RepID=A0A7N1A8R8_KALFE